MNELISAIQHIFNSIYGWISYVRYNFNTTRKTLFWPYVHMDFIWPAGYSLISLKISGDI